MKCLVCNFGHICSHNNGLFICNCCNSVYGNYQYNIDYIADKIVEEYEEIKNNMAVVSSRFSFRAFKVPSEIVRWLYESSISFDELIKKLSQKTHCDLHERIKMGFVKPNLFFLYI